LAAYGLSSQSVKLLENYLTGRKQQIKLQGVVSGWHILQKGVFFCISFLPNSNSLKFISVGLHTIKIKPFN
jgi:hypothetical protein